MFCLVFQGILVKFILDPPFQVFQAFSCRIPDITEGRIDLFSQGINLFFYLAFIITG